MTKFLVSVPQDWIDLKNYIINLDDVGEFYKNLMVVLDEMSGDVETTTTIKQFIETDGIYLSHHTNFKQDNVWNIKKGYLNGYLYFDRCGYSGWAEMADNEELFNESQAVDFNKAGGFFDNFSKGYSQTRSTKIKQGNQEFNLTEPYVFVAGQRPHDTVAELAYIPTLQLMEDVANAYRNTEYKVVVKIHPLEKHKQNLVYKFLDKYPNVIITDADIHDILPNASAVYTTNSGVGFEALLYLKRVFVSGKCEYHWAATELFAASDIKNTMHLLDEPVDKPMIIKFVYYMLSEYYVNSTDLNSIKRKIEQAIKEYNEIQNGQDTRSSPVGQSLD